MSIRSALLASVMASLVTSGLPSAAQDRVQEPLPADAPPPSRFRTLAASRLGAPEDAVQLGRIEGPIGLSDGELLIYAASAVVGLDGEKVVVTLDHNGQPVDLRAAYETERALVQARRGKLGERLARQLELRSTDERLPVVAWLETPEALRELRPAYAQIVSDAVAAGVVSRDYVEFHHTQMATESAERRRP